MAEDFLACLPLDQTAAYLFNRGENFYAQRALGARPWVLNGVKGVAFAVWAPNARAVYLVGSFADWQQGQLAMQPCFGGFWQIFVPGIGPGVLYKYKIVTKSGAVQFKADPFAFAAECRPATASQVVNLADYTWHDADWLAYRQQVGHTKRPMNIYELHLGSWRQGDSGPITYAELARYLPAYMRHMGYNYAELMPVMEHPYDGSWGYQLTGYFAPTARYGSPDDFKLLVDSLHRENIGVILDWVPGHFCRDAHGLAMFDGTALYEAEAHAQWGTYKFNFARAEVQSFLISNALFWLQEYHIDGLRVDGVTSMLYLNFGVDDTAQKRYNPDGSEVCRPAVQFLQRLSGAISQYCPAAFTVAEESTAWPQVTGAVADGGLGFDYKWDMGWMNDTLKYMAIDFDGRPYNHNLLTFSLMYAFSEKFVLPLSHDEVVHGKCSLIGKMPGDYWRQFANLRLLLLYQMTHSGAKLNFMGSEFGQFIEWRYDEPLEWFLLDYPAHAAHQNYVKSLNLLYLDEPALWQQNYTWQGFSWLDADNAAQSMLIFKRQATDPDDFVLVVLNFGVMAYADYEIGVPQPGVYTEIFNSDAVQFGGSGKINPASLEAKCLPKGRTLHGQAHRLKICVPPLGGVIIKPQG